MFRSVREKTVVAAILAANLVSAAADPVHAGANAPAALPTNTSQAPAASMLSSLPMVFEANEGQALQSFSHVARGPGYSLQLAPTEALLNLVQQEAANDSLRPVLNRRAVRMQLIGANARADAQSLDCQASVSNYFYGANADAHLTNVPQFAKVQYSGVYPGIDLVYYGNQGELEFDFVVKPGADPKLVKLGFSGAVPRVDASGSLILSTDLGDLRLKSPVVYQDTPAGRRTLSAQYALVENSTVTLQLGAYDEKLPLVIDPVLTYSAVVGGSTSADSYGVAIAVDAGGQAYIAGWTAEADFPITSGGYDRSIGRGDTDVFVLKLNAAGTALVYSTFLGGRTGVDYASGLAIDSAGNSYVTGRTSSSDFPVSTTSYQKGVVAGGSFVAKLSSGGNSLLYSTYLQNAVTRGVAVDGSGNAVVAGDASSSFLTTTGAYQRVSGNSAGRTGFVLKLNSTGSAPLFSTFIGGSGQDQIKAVTVDSAGAIFAAGMASSADFPVLNALQSTHGGLQDGFIIKLNATGTALIYSTYLGGAADDWVNAIALDASGNAYVAGTTGSTNFPVLNALRSTKGGKTTNIVWHNAFVTKLAPAGNELIYSTYLGGDACQVVCSSFGVGDQALGIALNAQGNAFVSGRAQSLNFPGLDSLVAPVPGNAEEFPFVLKMSSLGNALLYSTLLETNNGRSSNSELAPDGSLYSAVAAVAVDASGNVYATGNTQLQGSFPSTVVLGQLSFGDAPFILKLSTPPPVSLTLTSSALQSEAGQPITLNVLATNPDGSPASGSVSLMRNDEVLSTLSLANGTANTTVTLPIGVHRLNAIYRASGTEGVSPVLYQLVNSPAVCN